MSHKVYRICLLSVVIIAIVGGIFYYLNYVQDEADITEGTLVRQEQSIDEAAGGALYRIRGMAMTDSRGRFPEVCHE